MLTDVSMIASEDKKDERQSVNTDKDTTAEKATKKVSTKKRPSLQRKGIKKSESSQVIENDSDNTSSSPPPPPSKNYNLDFLDKLDDPNYNPFESKSAVVNNFDDSKPPSENPIQEDFNVMQVNEASPEKSVESDILIDTNGDDAEEICVPNPEKTNKGKKKGQKPRLEKNIRNKKASPIKSDLGNDEDSVPIPAKGYNLNFLDDLDNPNFNPFETKTSVTNNNEDKTTEDKEEDSAMETDQTTGSCKNEESKRSPVKPFHNKLNSDKKTENHEHFADNLIDENPIENKNSIKTEESLNEAPTQRYNLDFLNNLEDLNFNPFETKSVVSNEVSSLPVGEELSHDKSFKKTRKITFEINGNIEDSNGNLQGDFESGEKYPESSKQYDSTELDVSPAYRNLPKSTLERISQNDFDSDMSFALPEPMNVQKFIDSPVKDVSFNESLVLSEFKHSIPFSRRKEETETFPEDITLVNDSDFLQQFPQQTFRPTLVNRQQILNSNPSEENSNLAKLTLIHEARLLEKDKELAVLSQRMTSRDDEVEELRKEFNSCGEENKQMMMIVDEFEKTIGQILAEKEREQVCSQIERERVSNERNQILEDLQAVERAFNDLHRKYERTKEVIAGFKTNEDVLKRTVAELTSRYKKGEDKYDLLKTHAESKLKEANSRIEELGRGKASEIAKLQALLKKAEMRVNSLERAVEQKIQENHELTVICDELISKVGH